MNTECSRRSFVKAGAAAASVAGLMGVAGSAFAEEAAEAHVEAAAPSALNLTPIDESLLMPEELGQEWHEFKDSCGPLYPGYPHFDEFLTFVKDKLTEYGCVDILENHWDFESYIVNDWPEHENGSHWLTIDGESLPVATHLHLAAGTDDEGVTGELMMYNLADGEPEEGAFEGKIVCMRPQPMPEPPFEDSFLGSYVVTDTNYRSDPEPPAPMLTIVDPEVNNSWNTRWDFGQWGTMNKYAETGKAAGLIVLSNLTWGCAMGLIDRQNFRASAPAIVVDRVTADTVEAAALEGKEANMGLKAEFKVCDNWNFLYFLPGKNYGTDADEYITINIHVDAMALTQDNGALGALGVCHYFSQIPQEKRHKTLVFCIDTRHFIEGFETGNFDMDPYQVFPEVVDKVTVTIGLEHLGEMEGAEDYANNDMVPTGRPEYSFMKADDNDWCTKILIQAAIDSGLERADIKIDGRPGNQGKYKGLVRAVQASTHKLGKAVIGEAGNWPGAHTQMYNGLKYFGAKKFRDEVALWTQVTSNMMDADSIVYDICWSNINTAIRNLGEAGKVDSTAMEGMILNMSNIFHHIEAGEYDVAVSRLQKELQQTCVDLAPEGYVFDREFTGSDGTGDGSSMFVTLTIPEGEEFLAVYTFINTAIAKLEAKIQA